MIRKEPKPARKRPWQSKFTDKTSEDYYNLRAQGYTMAQAAKRLGTTRRTITNWSKDPEKPEFQEAFKAAEEAHLAWCEDRVHNILTGAEKATASQIDLLKFKLRARFREDWAEKKESTININDQTKNLSQKEFDDKVSEAIDTLFKGKNVSRITKPSSDAKEG